MKRRLIVILAIGLLLNIGVTTKLDAASAGEAVSGKMSTFLIAPKASTSKVQADLKANGFEVLASHKVGGSTSIVFTSATLKKMASKKERGFAAVLRALVSGDKVVITNPLYFSKAYMQSNYNDADAKAVLSSLNKTFPSLTNSKDALKASKLSGYQFMMGMPYYEDMDTVGKGDDKSLLNKAKASGKMVFSLKLNNGSTLVGLKLSKGTAKFANKIGAANAGVLPYTVLIEKGTAKTLAPKYNIALYYPLLSMTQFMTISTVPGEIVSELEAVFK